MHFFLVFSASIMHTNLNKFFIRSRWSCIKIVCGTDFGNTSNHHKRFILIRLTFSVTVDIPDLEENR